MLINIRTFKLFICIIALCIGTQHLLADEQINAEQLILRATENNLAESTQWLRLLHYNQGGTLHSRKQSYVKSRTFFLADNGHKNPQAELEENIRQFFSHNIKQRCTFPARFRWLSEQLELADYSQGLEHCSTFLKVQREVSAKKITLIFPSAYLNSASSVFGHTLLRIDTQENDEAVILNWAINYGAKLNENDGALKYAVKGITGLYDGQYFIVPYAQKIKEYGQMENRDIWEYPLALTQKEVTFLTEHLWELKDVNFDYFFFDENCSYRLLELLEVAKPELNLTQQVRLTEIPINTVKTLDENHLLETTIFRPSKERLLNQQFDTLSSNHKKLSKKISNDITIIQEEAFQALNAQQQLSVLQSAYDYLRFQQTQEERDTDIAKRSLELLKNINRISIQLNGRENEVRQTSLANNDGDILQTHDSHRLGITGGKLIDGESYQSIQYRMAYHDFLDNSEGFAKGAHIEGPSFTLKQSDSTTYIDQIKLLDIISLNPRTDIRQEFSWNLGIKAERSEEANTHLQTAIYGGGGLTWEFNNFLFYQLVSPRLAFSPDFEKPAKAGLDLKVGFIRNTGKNPSLLEFKALKITDEEVKYFSDFSQQIELARNHALRASFSYFEQENSTANNKSVELTYLYYF